MAINIGYRLTMTIYIYAADDSVTMTIYIGFGFFNGGNLYRIWRV